MPRPFPARTDATKDVRHAAATRLFPLLDTTTPLTLDATASVQPGTTFATV
jgi:hypothetical protein